MSVSAAIPPPTLLSITITVLLTCRQKYDPIRTFKEYQKSTILF